MIFNGQHKKCFLFFALSITACNTQSVGFYVDVTVDQFDGKSEICRIWTRKFNKAPSNSDASKSIDKDTPLVLLHGMGAGGAFFTLNVDGLAKFSTVYLIDLPGKKNFHLYLSRIALT